MADRGDTHYHLPSLNRWFAAASILFLVSCVWMVLDDFFAPWKTYQREFRRIERERAEESLEADTAQASMAREAELKAELAAAQASLDGRRQELQAAEEKLRQLRGDQFSATEAAKKSKQVFNWNKFLGEEELVHATGEEEKEEIRAKVRGFEDALFALEGKKQEIDLAVKAQEDVVARLRSGVTEIEGQMKAATKDVELVRKKLEDLAPTDLAGKVANFVRDDLPGLDFIGPNLKVAKVVLDNLTFELNFTKKKRIDMCMTCHMAIDREGFTEEGLEQPFRSHPRLDLFLTAKSPHPMSEVGCTICHRGSGEALDFQRADHRPFGEAETQRWEEEYHWHKQHYWDYPMLSSGYIEASCVQCHKTSMELIAKEAPRVTRGYQLFERYGCYACHKVDWFPTKRRPGPSLKTIRQKVSRDFIDAWVTNPKAFRPTTWMPQIFHLENFGPDDTIAFANYGEGPEIKGQTWNDSAVAAVSAFIWGRGRKDPLPPVPVEGDAARGRETFRLVGCFACHNVAPYGEEDRAEARDLAQQFRTTNEVGPNLRGIAAKLNPEWLFAWLKNPAAIWSETRMPDLRLDDQQAADLVAYVFEDPDGWFQDVPEGWQTGQSPYDMETLREQARWFFSRTPREELARRFEEEWSDPQELLEVVGGKFVEAQGCHSCHEIEGMENAQPIGTELSNWGSKTIDKLDWGFMPEILAEQHGWSFHELEEYKQYRENWIEQKLDAPRSYDRRKVKNPTEKLKMPWFGFTHEQIEDIATFVVGLVNDEVQHARMNPDPGKDSMNRGLQVIRQKNCAGCHLIEPGTIEFDDEDGVHRAVRGQFLTLEDELLPPPVKGFHRYLDDYVDYMREEDEEFEVEEVIVQLLEPTPGVGEAGSTVVVENVDSIRTQPPWGGDIVDLISRYYLDPWRYDEEIDDYVSASSDPEGEGRILDVDGQYRAYDQEPYPKVRWTFAPPVLLEEGSKLQRDWFYEFLLDPVPLRQQLRIHMPTFNWAEGEAGHVADYFAYRGAQTWPSRFARQMLVSSQKTPQDVADEIQRLELPAVTAEQIQDIVDGDPVAIAATFPKLRTYADAVGFRMSGPVDPSYEAVPQRAPSHLDPLLAANPDFFEQVHRLAVDGPNCVQCHFLQGRAPTAEGPIAWAPELDYVRDRLRPDWVREWLHDPNKKYPGTAMPANFPPDELVYQDLYPGTSEDQIEAILTWLFNLDRAAVRN